MQFLAQPAESFSAIPEWVKFLTSAGGATVMVLVGWAVHTGRLCLGREVKDLKSQLEAKGKECDKWEAMALRALDNTARGQTLVERVVNVTEAQKHQP